MVNKKKEWVESRGLNCMMDYKGILYVSENVNLSECFIKNNAYRIKGNVAWRSLILNQRHIEPCFFDRFVSEMDETTKNILSRRKVMFDLVKLLKRI